MSIKPKAIEEKKIVRKKDGVTLMTLVITIVLILILSGAILLTVSFSDPVEETNIARVKMDIQTMKDSYKVLYDNLFYKNLGDENKIKDSDFEDVIPDEYKEEFKANKDGIEYIGDDEQIKEIAKEMDIVPKEKELIVDLVALGKVTSVEIETLIETEEKIEEYIYYIREVGETEWKEYRSEDPKIEIEGLKEKTKYEVKVEVIKDGKPIESDIKEVMTKELEAGNIIMKINDRNGENYINDTWTKENVYIEVKGANTTYTATGANTVEKTTNPTTLTKEGVTKVVLETKEGASVITKEYTVKIDKQAPDGRLERKIIPKGVDDGNIEVTIEDPTDNLSGIKEYEYYIDGEPRAVSKSNEYTYENLKRGDYEIKVIIVDNANNKKELKIMVPVGIPDANEERFVKVEKSPTIWTNGNVDLKVTFMAEEIYTPQYSIDKKTWENVERVCEKVIELNAKVYVRYIYEEGGWAGKEREIVIDNIDKDLPEIISLESTNTRPTNQDVKIIGKAKDTLSGLIAYQFSKDGSLTATSGGWETIPNTKEEITKEYMAAECTTYYFYVKDEAGNVSKKGIYMENIDKEKPKVKIGTNGGTYVIPVGSTSINITTKLDASDTGTSGLNILQYQISTATQVPSDSDANWKNFTNGATITESRGGGTHYLYTKVTDRAGNRAEEIKKSAAYIIKYQVKYDANNGEGAPTEQAKTHNENLTLQSTIPTRRGHTFKGWSTDKNASVPQYSAGGSYTTNAPVLLYAVWERNIYTVTYNYSENGGTSATKTTDRVRYLDNIDLSPTATKANYQFVGWNTNKDATTGLTTLQMDAGNVTLYAIFRKPLTGTFNYFNGSTAAAKTVTGYAYNKATTVQITTPTIANATKDGVTYAQRGWSTSSAANASISVASGGKVTLSANTTYYASYSQTITATFYYNTNKSTTGAATRYMNYAGGYTHSNIAVPTAVSSSAGPSSTSYHHVATSKTGGAVTPNTGTTKYYAVYAKTVTATKYVYNNSSSTAKGTAYGYYDGTTANASINLGTTSLSGYGFRGWSTSSAANASITVAANGNASILNNTTYYASYTQTITATFYYYASKSATSSATRYMNYAGGYVQVNISIPSAVSSSTGPSSTSYHHVATSKTGGSATPTTATTTYYAVYAKTVTATKYVYNNSSSTARGTAYGYYDGTTTNASIALGTTSLSGYGFRGWSTSSAANASISVSANGNASILNNTTYYASYTQTITATFYYYASKSATSSATRYMNYAGGYVQANISVPAAVSSSTGPSSTSYHHVATSKTGGSATPTTATTTYYAVYAKTVTATKYVYNNSSSTAKGTAYGYYDGTTANASINLGTTSLSGYGFRGWSTSSAANASISVSANGNASILNNTTYYASYTQTVTARFYYYSSTSTTAQATRYMNYVGGYVHANFSIPSAVSSSTGPSGTTFSHVATSKTGEAVQPTTETLTYYTVYRKTVTATKYIYKGRSTPATGAAYGYYDGTTKNASINLGTSSANGYTFRGWRTSIAANGAIDVAANGSVSIINDTSYYAAYSYTVYIYYNLNGGSGSVSATSGTAYMNYAGDKYAGSVSVSTRSPSRTDYSFDGWYTSSSGGTKKTGSISLTSDYILYAHWSSTKSSWIEFENVTSSGFDVYLYTTDMSISSVVFPTWTTSGGQDDMKWHVSSLVDTSLWNVFHYYVSVSQHNNERGEYEVHAYKWNGTSSVGTPLDGGKVTVPSSGGGTVITPPVHTCNTANYCTTLHTHTSYWSCTCGGTHIQYRHAMCSICGKRSPVSWWKCPNQPEGSPVVCQ